ncbi:MAG: DUF4249 domain-containing protein [Paludibacteraceae bacterium]|nr:DUF4249 domain-containing protein [Paludibacteraceae bacterium]
MRAIFSIFLSFLPFVGVLTSCEEDIVIDAETGDPKIGIYGSITTDRKHHSITISRTMDFYSDGDIEMISGAYVFIVDQTDADTFFLAESSAGIYETDSVAGKINHSYQLNVAVPDRGDVLHFYAESTIDTCPGKIDSVQVLKYTMFDVVNNDVYKVCPYFQTTKKNIYYMFDMSLNETPITDTLSRKALLHLGAMSGLYYNGVEMSVIYKELNVYPHGIFYLDQTLTKEKIHKGDMIHITLYGIPKGYYGYLSDISNSIGSNPLMGSPTNVRTNIRGKEKEAVGYFYAASCIHFQQEVKKLPVE